MKPAVSAALPPGVADRLQAAAAALRTGRPGEARALLAPVIAAHPRTAEARRLCGLALEREGDLAGAEAELRLAVAADTRSAIANAALGDLLARAGHAPQAERAYRAALALDRRLVAAALPLSRLLLGLGRAEEALQALTPLAVVPVAEERVLAQQAVILKALGRPEEAAGFNARAVRAAPASAVAEHNLAATLGDLARFEESEAAAARALAKGGEAPETWLVRARALQHLGRLEEAEGAFREAVRRRPAYAEAHREFGQLIWMRTEDVAAAVAPLDRALAGGAGSAELSVQKAKLLEFAGELDAAAAVLDAALAREPGSVLLQLSAADLAARRGRPEAQARHAGAAAALAPESKAARVGLCASALALGEAERAAALAQALRADFPLDQYVLALQATAWRLLGDPRYAALYDYAALVKPWRLETPPGWASRDAWLAELTAALERAHPFRTHPLDQSLRHGSQAPHLAASTEPAIVGFFRAIKGPVRAHIEALGRGRDPLRERAGRGWRVQGAWSVRLRPNGFHTDHVHPEGWLSSACYIGVPEAVVGSAAREGWIKFGEPGVATVPKLGPEHFVQPEPGLLVLFPSYMWHGTVPFGGDQPRLTIAFDLVPAK